MGGSIIGNLNLDLNELRSLVLEAMKKEPETQYENVCSNIAEIAVNKKIVSNPRPQNTTVYGGYFVLQKNDKELVREVIWNLIIERVITLGMNSDNPTWPWLKLTAYGKTIVSSKLPVPHDPSGYLKQINIEIPALDKVILIYLKESINTYNINALLSATITLGCASEKALLLLIESYTNAIQGTTRQQKFRQRTEGKMIKRQFDEFTKAIRNIIGNMPNDVSDGIDNILLGIFEMIRNYRNDAGHPTGKIPCKEQIYANLQVFITYCKKVYQLKDYFNNNPI